MHAQLLTVAETSSLIQGGKTLLIAGDESLLQLLPAGKWIGGSIPYFMAESGGIISRDRVFVHSLPAEVKSVKISNYDTNRLAQVAAEAPDNGFSVIILPAGSKVHTEYAQNAPGYEGMFINPIIGWISGVHLSDLGHKNPKVFNGETRTMSDQEAVVLHASLPMTLNARIGIVNLFSQGQGDTFVFPKTAFQAESCFINGKEVNLAEYLTAQKIDTQLPLVANYHGAMINVSFQSVDQANRKVSFYAPVFDGVEYKLARPVSDYMTSFQSALPNNLNNIAFCCNCILNFLYSELEGKRIETFLGPMTFGEVAYQLLNQTLVYLRIEES
ncbi:hypothetical protein TI04_05335 [Achromatium sp. WMS2]|nr:hypothetical protein TI04_05335 [Achromatium sp. WMS2]